MWAGGRLQTHAPLRLNETAVRQSRVLATRQKTGRSGLLTFITIGHQIYQGGNLAVDEQQDIVYREVPAHTRAAPDDTDSTGAVVPATADDWEIDVTPTLLFRFSALTYNSHRIHYDRDYATLSEGYPGLLTHGPFQALAMAELARRRSSDARDRPANHVHYEYRLEAPLFDFQGMIVSCRAEKHWLATAVRDRHGRQTAIGRWSAENRRE
jgi:3-methylfumaryl-CoA hydratase